MVETLAERVRRIVGGELALLTQNDIDAIDKQGVVDGDIVPYLKEPKPLNSRRQT